MELWEKLKSVFVNWKRLLEQIPDQDRKESYRYDEIQKKWVLLSSMPESEVPILDDNRRLQVETPNFYELSIKDLSTTDTSRTVNYYLDLDFLADSITIFVYNVSGITGGAEYTMTIYYNLDSDSNIQINTFTIDDNEDQEYQWDCKPYNKFRVYLTLSYPESTLQLDFKVMFSKQKKTKISDTTFASSWNGIIDIGASKNALYDKINGMDTLIGANTTQTEVETIITAELVEGQSIDNRIDTLIGAETHLETSDVEDVIIAELVGGQSIDNAIDSLISAYGSTQHTRRITPCFVIPQDGITAGANNVYMIGGNFIFGITSKTAEHNLQIRFLLPDDYVDGTDLIFKTGWMIENEDNPNTIDYFLRPYRSYDGAQADNEGDINSTWSGADNWYRNFESITITGTNFNAGDGLFVQLRMEDDNNAIVVYLLHICLDITVNMRD